MPFRDCGHGYWDLREKPFCYSRVLFLYEDILLLRVLLYCYIYPSALLTESLGCRDKNTTTEAHMSKEEIRWHCPNRDCEWSLVTMTTEKLDDTPQCVCGKTMKRGTAAQAFQYLDFLRDGTATEQAVGPEEE